MPYHRTDRSRLVLLAVAALLTATTGATLATACGPPTDRRLDPLTPTHAPPPPAGGKVGSGLDRYLAPDR